MDRLVYVRESLADVSYQNSATHCDNFKVETVSIANVYRHPSEPWSSDNFLPTLPHPAVYLGDFNRRQLVVDIVIASNAYLVLALVLQYSFELLKYLYLNNSSCCHVVISANGAL